jgi:hypothetical protein
MKKLDDETLEKLTDRTNRSKGQTNFLYDLLNGDLNKLLDLEEKVKNNVDRVHTSGFCPADPETAEWVLSLPGKGTFNLDEFRKNE